MESDPICRRNNFAELHACVFQRLTKYPLLISSLIKQTQHLSNMAEELARIRDAEAGARDLLSKVNHDIRMWENKHFLDLVLKKCAPLSSCVFCTRPLQSSSVPVHCTRTCTELVCVTV